MKGRFILAGRIWCLAAAAALGVSCSSEPDDGAGPGGGGASPLAGIWEVETSSLVESTCAADAWSTDLNDYRFGAFGDGGSVTSVRFGLPFTDDVLCEVTASSFDCRRTTSDTIFGTTLTYEYHWHGTFDVAGTVTGGSEVALGCTGSDCNLVGTYPCAVHVAFTATRVGPHPVDPYAPCADGVCPDGQECNGGYCHPRCGGTHSQCVGSETASDRCTGQLCASNCEVGGAPCPVGFECTLTQVRPGDAYCVVAP